MSKEHRLPDGTWTADVDLFVHEWDKIRKPFEALGFRVIGFDPGIALCDANTNGGAFDLPLYAAKRIIEAITANGEVQRPGAEADQQTSGGCSGSAGTES